MAEKQISGRKGSIFDLDGVPPLRQALPLAIQHVVAMIVGCVTPAILVSNAAGLAVEDRVLLIQAALVIAALSTFIQLFPIFGVLGSRLPMIMGVSFAYVPSLVAIAGDYDVATIFGAQIVGGVVAILVGLFVKKLRVLFPPLITGTVVFTIGLSLYPTAVNYMAGGTGNTDAARLATPALLYGSWQNWMIAILTLIAVTVLNHYAKGLAKLASILLGMAFGYVVAAFFGMVDLSPVAEAGFFQLPKIMHFGISFDISACTAIGILFAINSIQAIGDYTATTIGGMDREPTDGELQRGIVAYGASNILGAVLGGLPTATYSQNVGIVVTTKVINRIVLGMAAALILLAGLVPKFSAILTTIPQCVLGKTAKSILISCGARLAPFDIKELRELMETDEMELDTIGDRKTALFVIISDTDDTFNFVVSILYTQLFNLLCDKADDEYGGRLPVHVRCLLDEFANIGQIPKFEKLIATIRSREISASIILQSQSQLKAIYKDNADTIVGNCDTTLFLGGKEKTTLKEISEILGKETIDSFNTSETRGRELSHGLNYQKLGKQLMTEDEIAVMDGGKCILQLRGVRPFFSDKFDITKHPKYKYLSDADPKNAFDMEKHLKRRPAIVKPDEVFDYYEIDAADLQEDADHEET